MLLKENKEKKMFSDLKKFQIPDYVFETNQKPIIIGNEITYICNEFESPYFGHHMTESLTSAYIWGFKNIDKYDAQKSKVVDYSLDQKWVEIALVEK